MAIVVDGGPDDTDDTVVFEPSLDDVLRLGDYTWTPRERRFGTEFVGEMRNGRGDVVLRVRVYPSAFRGEFYASVRNAKGEHLSCARRRLPEVAVVEAARKALDPLVPAGRAQSCSL